MSTLALPQREAAASIRFRFVLTIFLGSFLLFLVQPMIARMALPRLGGAPAVWNSAMLVYQALLLAGYAYAHQVSRLSFRQQISIHLCLFAIAGIFLPIGLSAATPGPNANPIWWTPALLFSSIGPLFFVVSAQAPLIQRWYVHAGGDRPYHLYAASNLGSFSGLLCYPLVLEPLLTTGQQSWIWTGGYAALFGFLLWIALATRNGESSREAGTASASPPSRSEIARWICIAAVPSGLILSTTLHLTTDIVAMPLLWVLPLGLYLLSFTIAFAENRSPARVIQAIASTALFVAIFASSLTTVSEWLLNATLALAALFLVSTALHSRLFDSRPDPHFLTTFYLALSVGGVIGGLFCALLAPLLFDWTYEHWLLLIAAAFLLDSRSPFARVVDLWDGSRNARRMTMIGMVVAGLLAIACLLDSPLIGKTAFIGIASIAAIAIGNRPLFGVSVAAMILCQGGWTQLEKSASPGSLTRSFFGVYSIDGGPRQKVLSHGTTLHGVQNLGSPERERMPTSYYAPGSGVGVAMRTAPALFRRPLDVVVVGLGAGTLACYARPGDTWTFLEIDPAVERIARNPRQFRFLADCLPNARVIIGDARLTLPSADIADILIIDAFSSDSIPMHLLTKEAFEVYRRQLRPDGLLMVHVSNRNLHVEPVVAGAANAGGWHAIVRSYTPTPAEIGQSATSSAWIALSPNANTLARLAALGGKEWRPIDRSSALVWTDDYGSVLPILKLNW